MKYCVIETNEGVGKLVQMTNSMVAEGWTPQGGIAAVTQEYLVNQWRVTFYQALFMSDINISILSFKDRVKRELSQLEENILKLDRFLGSDTFDALSSDEQSRLMQQSIAMKGYADILRLRIKADFK